MTHDLTSRARQLLADIGLKEPAWNPPPGHAEYETLVACVADHLTQVAAEARGTTNPCDKIFVHKWLSPECVETGCQSLLLLQRAERAEELADKYKWQVRDTCTRAEKAEAALASLRAPLAEAGEALEKVGCRCDGHCRYNPGAEMRFCKYEHCRLALASIQTARREMPTLNTNPLDFP